MLPRPASKRFDRFCIGRFSSIRVGCLMFCGTRLKGFLCRSRPLLGQVLSGVLIRNCDSPTLPFSAPPAALRFSPASAPWPRFRPLPESSTASSSAAACRSVLHTVEKSKQSQIRCTTHRFLLPHRFCQDLRAVS